VDSSIEQSGVPVTPGGAKSHGARGARSQSDPLYLGSVAIIF
jgi:hypothetical protein